MDESSIDFGNMAEFDAVAESISARLRCDLSLVSIVQDDALRALGHSGGAAYRGDRTMAARDTVCARTIGQGTPLRVPDVRQHPGMRDAPSVAAMKIGAYLGVPLRLEDGRVVGAVCAIAHAPRIWSDGELAYLTAVADLVESKIERHVLRFEQMALSAALAENDAILTTLAETRGKALTVHNDAGELVFANTALRTDLGLSYQELLVLPRAAQRIARDGAQTGAISVDLPGRPNQALSVFLHEAKSGLTLAEWSRAHGGDRV